MTERFYEVVVDMDQLEDGTACWFVTVPAFPEIATDGADQEIACRNALSAIEEAIAARIATQDDVPLPNDDIAGTPRMVQLSVLSYLKLSLYLNCRDQKVSRAELMRRLDWKRESVDRLFRLDHHSKLSQIEEAFAAIGVPIGIDVPMPQAA